MLTEILLRMKGSDWLDADVAASLDRDVDGFVANAVALLADTTMLAVGEFGRTVHAEMSALLDAARRGVAVDACALFTTTFPCHNCTKHIAAAGIGRVVYVAPYPKSRAEELHGDSIVVDSASRVAGKVNFEPFVGVAPRRYTELFSKPDRENADGSVKGFDAPDAMPRVPSTTSHVEAESMAIGELAERLARAGLKAGAPRTRRREP
jgi:cytidine deaminase